MTFFLMSWRRVHVEFACQRRNGFAKLPLATTPRALPPDERLN